MGSCTAELYPEDSRPDGHTFRITIETGLSGLARLNVACLQPESDDVLNSQGADLTAAECRALAKMLTATADLVDQP